MDQIRRSLGICPQHNILFDRLTVKEHLSFFLKLKVLQTLRSVVVMFYYHYHKQGISDSAYIKSEVGSMIEELQLTDKVNVQASNLSGGQKRKLR